MNVRSIQNLPILSGDDFSPETDFVLVQRPNGGTYKMRAVSAFALEKDENGNLVYKQSNIQEYTRFISHNEKGHKSSSATYNVGENIVFEQDELFNQSSSFSINVRTINRANGTAVGASGGSFAYKWETVSYDSVGTTRTSSFTKNRGGNFINGNIAIGSQSTAQNIGYFEHTRSDGWNLWLQYKMIIDTTETDKIVLSFQRIKSAPKWYPSGYWAAWQADIIVTITTEIRSD